MSCNLFSGGSSDGASPDAPSPPPDAPSVPPDVPSVLDVRCSILEVSVSACVHAMDYSVCIQGNGSVPCFCDELTLGMDGNLLSIFPLICESHDERFLSEG